MTTLGLPSIARKATIFASATGLVAVALVGCGGGASATPAAVNDWLQWTTERP